MITHMHHAAIITGDIDRSRRFYEDVLGFKCVGEFSLKGPEVEKVVDLENVRLRAAMLQLGQDETATLLELIQYESPQSDPIAAPAKSNDLGCAHIAFAVEDVDAVYERLRKHDVTFHCPPQVVVAGALGSVKVTYFRDPDGVILEILQPLA